MSPGRLAALAALATAALGCRVDCTSAADCGRGEMCATDGTCSRLPDAVPITSITPGPTMEALAVYPPPGVEDAPVRTTVVVLTTRAVDPMTVGATTFTMEDARRQAVAGSFDWLVDPPGFLFAPAAGLVEGASYNVKVTTGVKDGGGTPLRLPVSWSFTVR